MSVYKDKELPSEQGCPSSTNSPTISKQVYYYNLSHASSKAEFSKLTHPITQSLKSPAEFTIHLYQSISPENLLRAIVGSYILYIIREESLIGLLLVIRQSIINGFPTPIFHGSVAREELVAFNILHR